MKALKTVALSLFILVMAGCANHNKPPEYLTYVQIGDKVPISRFVDTQGNSIDLTQSNNNKLLILFATWCHDSQRTMQQLANSDLHLSPNIDIIGIGREENADALTTFAAKYELNFPLIADEDRAIYSMFANSGIPRLILLDPDNKVVKTIIGEKENTIEEVVW